jgi:hypothetical protein
MSSMEKMYLCLGIIIGVGLMVAATIVDIWIRGV